MEVETGEYKSLVQAQGVLGKAYEVARRLRPPRSEDPGVRAWRRFIVAITVGNFLGLAAQVALAWGLTPAFSGFAKAAEQQATQVQVVAGRIEALQWRLNDLRVQQCAAIAARTSPQAYTVQMGPLEEKLRELLGREPKVPTCAELGFTG